MNPSFESFYEELWGRAPFPWQVRLAAVVDATGSWPTTLALPTASGKTSVVEVALWALARAPLAHPRRVVFVVDRRLIVDQAADHARAVLDGLRSPGGPACAAVAAALREAGGLAADEAPFAVSVLRGGVPREDVWARRPEQVTVVLSTVDQVGSRLLFSGYGVSDRMAPVHAGLLGNDALFLLDEVHLSAAFAQTLAAVAARFRRPAGGLPDRWAVVSMSATPGDGEADAFSLDPADLADPALARRLAAHKRARLVSVGARGAEAARKTALIEAVACEARALRQGGAETIGVVVNRVETARRVYARLAEEGDDVALLTGRMRPLDRDATITRLLPRVRAGRARGEGGPLYVVATQCIEAGADFDFDALVTECASLDALRQRFGRLDRLGERGESTAAVVVRDDQVSPGASDPVYGEALGTTWRWLAEHGDAVDFGVQHLPIPPDAAALAAPRADAPVLLPAHIEAWARTSARPWPLPDVAAWLHGLGRESAEVSVVWRADLPELGEDPRGLDAVGELLAACPPGRSEALTLPLAAVRRWLDGDDAAPVADVPEAPEAAETGDRRRGEGARRALRWGADGCTAVAARELRPGDTLVVPGAWGGLTAGSWDPDGVAPVSDLGDRVQLGERGRATLRLDARTLPEEVLLAAGPVPDPSVEGEEAEAAVVAWLAALRGTAWEELSSPRRRRVIATAEGRRIVVARRGWGGAPSTEDDGASFTGCAVELGRHLRDVAGEAERMARSLGLPDALVGAVVRAARLHDVGKADPRFQRMLHGGSEIRWALTGELLAKSDGIATDARARGEARSRAGYPRGYRHELLSVALVANTPSALGDVSDAELVLHLVGSHHGWCRPFAPATGDDNPVDVALALDGVEFVAGSDHGLARVGSGVADRYDTLTRRYGWWGLAWLEAILRLADHRASEAEAKEGS